jgi:16S rRNA (guanine527-N7)-methyltransferase
MLRPHLLNAGVEPGPAIELLKRYALLLVEWNRGVSNLFSRNDEPRIVERHIAESIEPAHWLKASGAMEWVDFGSGGGLPAIPLAIAGVGEHWTLVESRHMKTLFMRKTLDVLSLKNIDVVCSRLETWAHDAPRRGCCQGFTSRATARLVPTLALAADLVAPGGHAFLWKGTSREAEMAADDSWKVHWDFDGLLGIGDGRTVVAKFSRRS